MPQQAWTKKQERQYEHINQNERQRGRSEDRAEEIAARTVKQATPQARRNLRQDEPRHGQSESVFGRANETRALQPRAAARHPRSQQDEQERTRRSHPQTAIVITSPTHRITIRWSFSSR